MKTVELEAKLPVSSHSQEGQVIRFAPSKRVERRNGELIGIYHCSKNPAVLQEIIGCNQGLLHTVLRRFFCSREPYEDLLQVANLGLIKAVQRFDSARGIEFSSYATAIVDGEIRHYLRDNVLMRQPRWLRKVKKRIEDASVELSRKLNRPPSLRELSEEVNISQEGILEILSVYAEVGLHPADDPVSPETLNPQPALSTLRSLHNESFTLPLEDKVVLYQALGALSAFHKKIVYLLFYRDLTQSEAAKEMGLTQRKVSRESAKALGRLKAILNTRIF